MDELGTWVDWVKSRIRSLLVKLEELHALCDPNPTEFIDMSIQVPHIVVYWGLVPGRGNNLDLNAAREDFMRNLSIGYQVNLGQMTLTIVPVSQLPKMLQLADNHIKAQLRWFNHQQQMIPVYSTLASLCCRVQAQVTAGNPKHADADGSNYGVFG